MSCGALNLSCFMAAAAAEGHGITSLLLALAAILISAKVLGDLAQRVGQPSVLGELLAGILLGPSLIGLVDPSDSVIFALGELGVLILLFQIGLHTDLKSILKVGAPATMVGLAGVVLPFAGGYGVAMLLGLDSLTAIVCGAALTATSIGISARVLSDLGQLKTAEGRIVLGAAVLDDVIGLIILSVVSGLAAGAALTGFGIAMTAATALGFLAVALIAGRPIARVLVRIVSRIQVEGALGALSLALALALAAAADAAGSAMIIGAFAAGILLGATHRGKEIETKTTALGYFFVPIFFAVVGASIDLRSLADSRVLLIGGALCVVAIVGKFVSGYAPWWFQGNKALVGVAMIPRGEVGLIFAQMGLSTGALDQGLFSAVVLMVMVTTFIAPPWLAALGGGARVRTSDGLGLDDLVAGERRQVKS